MKTLREARKRKGLTQRDVASIVGITPTALSFIENYKSFPQPKVRKRLLKIFGPDLEFYPASVLNQMIVRFIGTDPKTSIQRAKLLREHINRILECTDLNIRDYNKPIKR